MHSKRVIACTLSVFSMRSKRARSALGIVVSCSGFLDALGVFIPGCCRMGALLGCARAHTYNVEYTEKGLSNPPTLIPTP